VNQWTGIADELQYIRAGFLAQKLANSFADSIKPVMSWGRMYPRQKSGLYAKKISDLFYFVIQDSIFDIRYFFSAICIFCQIITTVTF
jgi:hypothetical protein